MNRTWMMAALTAVLAACASRTPEQQVIDAAATALGGRDRLLAVRTIALEDGSGRHYNLGQDMRPGARGQTFEVTALSRRYDLAGERTRIELTRTPNFAYFQGPAPQRQIQGVDGQVGYNLGANGNAAPRPRRGGPRSARRLLPPSGHAAARGARQRRPPRQRVEDRHGEPHRRHRPPTA